jgi:hypothetical protein
MKVNGKMISKKEKEQCGIPTKINMKVSGIKVRKMDLESTIIIMVPYMKATLQMEGKMVLEQLHLQMEQESKLIGIKLI